MAKYYGLIGYYDEEREIRPGVWTKEGSIQERPVTGDVKVNYKQTENSGEVNDSINVNIKISFVADPFANENFHKIKYATYNGTKWKVTSVEPKFPRLIITLGGVYIDQF